MGLLILALLVSATFWYFGVDAWHSLLLGAAITSILVAASVCMAAGTFSEPAATDWHDSGHAGRKGSRHDIAYLSSALRGKRGRVGYVGEARLRQLAHHRLELHHLELKRSADRLEVERLLGHRAYRLLVRDRRRSMRLRSVVYCLDRLERMPDPASQQKDGNF